jgi:multicomponent Na+:H+ antiporter subunit E
MQLFAVNFLIALLWALLTGNLSVGNLFVGFLLGYLALFLMNPSATETNSYFQKTVLFFSFMLYFVKELIVSSTKVAVDVIKPNPLVRPGIIGIPMDAETDLEITLLANVISLTPGTLSLEVSKDRKILYIHAMYVVNPDDFRKEIKDGIEHRLLELLR